MSSRTALAAAGLEGGAQPQFDDIELTVPGRSEWFEPDRKNFEKKLSRAEQRRFAVVLGALCPDRSKGEKLSSALFKRRREVADRLDILHQLSTGPLREGIDRQQLLSDLVEQLDRQATLRPQKEESAPALMAACELLWMAIPGDCLRRIHQAAREGGPIDAGCSPLRSLTIEQLVPPGKMDLGPDEMLSLLRGVEKKEFERVQVDPLLRANLAREMWNVGSSVYAWEGDQALGKLSSKDDLSKVTDIVLPKGRVDSIRASDGLDLEERAGSGAGNILKLEPSHLNLLKEIAKKVDGETVVRHDEEQSLFSVLAVSCASGKDGQRSRRVELLHQLATAPLVAGIDRMELLDEVTRKLANQEHQSGPHSQTAGAILDLLANTEPTTWLTLVNGLVSPDGRAELPGGVVQRQTGSLEPDGSARTPLDRVLGDALMTAGKGRFERFDAALDGFRPWIGSSQTGLSPERAAKVLGILYGRDYVTLNVDPAEASTVATNLALNDRESLLFLEGVPVGVGVQSLEKGHAMVYMPGDYPDRSLASSHKAYRDGLHGLTKHDLAALCNTAVIPQEKLALLRYAKLLQAEAPTRSIRIGRPEATELNGRIPDLQEITQIHQETLQDPNLPFAYIKEGCYARAHAVCEKLVEKGINCRKLFIIQDSPQKLSLTNGLMDATWRFHVAPVVVARDGEREALFVLDGSVSPRPLPVKEWSDAPGSVPAILELQPISQYNLAGETPDDKSFEDNLPLSREHLQHYREALNDVLAERFSTP